MIQIFIAAEFLWAFSNTNPFLKLRGNIYIYIFLNLVPVGEK